MSAAFSRLVWKEYRSQRPLWVALAVAAALANLAAVWMYRFRMEFDGLAAIAVTMTVAFGVASVTMAFVGEEDDGTAVWLRLFPVSTGTLLFAKISAAVVGMLSLFAVSLIAGAAGSIILRRGIRFGFTDPGLLLDWLRTFVGLLTFLLLALNCSLRSTKVFSALTSSAVWMLLFAILAKNTAEGPMSLLPLTVTGLAVVSVLPSIRRWHHGRIPTEQARRPGLLNGLVRWCRTCNSGREAIWERRLQAAAGQAPLSKRTIRVLLWRELRFAVPFLRGCVAIAVGLLVFQVVVQAAEFPSMAALGIPAILEAGLRTFRHDQQQLNGMFWSHRGVSPAIVWLTRIPVWLGTLLLLVVLMAACEFAVWQMFFGETPWAMNSFLTAQILKQWNAGEYSVFRVTAAVIAAGFAQAQLSSAWIRKPILAAFSALATMVGVIGWILHCEMLKIPQWTSVWPFVVLCLVLTFVTRQQWMDRQSSVRLIVIRIMSLAVFCLCALSATMTWRALEIPDMGSTAAAGLSSHDAAAAAIGRLGPQQLYEHYGYYDGCDSTPWAKAWDRFQASGSKVGGADEVKDPVTGHLVLPWEVARREAVSALDEILAGDLTTQRLPPKFRVPWTSHDLSGIATRILTSEALLRSEEELPKQAAERLIQAVRLDRYFREEATGWSTWLAAVSQELSVLDVFQRLVSDERLTEEDLSDLQEQLTAVIAFPTPGMNVAANREVVWEQLLLRDGYLWGEYQREQRSGFSSERLFEFPAHIMANRSWPERYRSLRLLRLINHRLGNGYRDDSSASVSQAQDWFATSVEQDTDIYVYDPVLTGGLNSPVEQQFRTCFLAERAAVVAVALQRYRRQNGMFPASLTELGEVGIPGDSGFIRDVDGENLLGYAPGGLGFPIPFVDDYRYGYLLHPQQPVLWTPGLSSPIAFRRDLIPSPPLPPLCQMAEPQPNRVCFISGGTRFGVQPGFDEMIHKAREFAELVSKAGGSEMLQQGNAPESLAGRPGWKHLPKLTVPDVDKSSADH